MQQRLKELMEEKAIKELESMDNMVAGSDGRRVAAENASKIYKALADEESQRDRARNDKRNCIMACAGGITAALIHSIWHYSDIWFEEHGGFSNAVSRTTAQSLNKFSPFKLK